MYFFAPLIGSIELCNRSAGNINSKKERIQITKLLKLKLNIKYILFDKNMPFSTIVVVYSNGNYSSSKRKRNSLPVELAWIV